MADGRRLNTVYNFENLVILVCKQLDKTQTETNIKTIFGVWVMTESIYGRVGVVENYCCMDVEGSVVL